MRLQKILSVAVLLLATVSTFVSCSKDDPEPPKKTIDLIIKHDIAGTYNCESEMFMGTNSTGKKEVTYTITANGSSCSFDFPSYRSGMDKKLVTGLGVKDVTVSIIKDNVYELKGKEQEITYYKGEGEEKEPKKATMSCKGKLENGELSIVVYFQPGRAPHKFKYIIKGKKNI